MDKITRTFDRMLAVCVVFDVKSESVETQNCYVYTSNELKAKKRY